MLPAINGMVFDLFLRERERVNASRTFENNREKHTETDQLPEHETSVETQTAKHPQSWPGWLLGRRRLESNNFYMYVKTHEAWYLVQ